MTYTTLISPRELLPHLDDPNWAIVDCRFDLLNPEAGETTYLESHIPGAVYVHLERDLSAEPTGKNGRHPLPSVEDLADVFSRLGIQDGVQVIGYDASGGGFAARLWWCLRYLGHDAVAVLDGGFPAWEQGGHPTRSGRETRLKAGFKANVRESMRLDMAEILAELGSEKMRLIDARAPERYRGETEPYDPVAGRIPGALNHPWKGNLDEESRFLPPEALRAQLETLLGETLPQQAVFYCGSGVTACHDLLAMEHAGLRGARLYPGSWSEWCADPACPVVTGDETAEKRSDTAYILTENEFNT
ncbi:MAG: sulfurtransferase [Candidatus Bipolaricaulia bacterium]